jgi:hypothetical protein
MHGVVRTLFGLLVLLLSAPHVSAQSTAQINGSVADSSAAVLPGVTVIAIQIETGFRRETVTDENGSYTLPNLPLGPYRIEASLSGFRAYVQTGVVLQVGSNPVIAVKLEIGSLEETVSVEASAPLVETRNPSIGQVITNEQVEALPLEGRNATSLIILAGAAVDTGTQTSRSMTAARGIAIAGGQAFGVAYTLDGANHIDYYDGFNLPLPFPDALQEFRVETNSQNAQNGVKAGGTVSLVTKSGTNMLRGDVFEFFRHHRFNATSPFAGTNPATGKRLDDGLKRNQFGGTLGGPIVSDTLFFFGGYQLSRSAEIPADLIAFVPTAAMLAGDFTQFASAACNARGAITLRAPFVNNRIDPARLSRAAVNLAQKLPSTTDPCGRTTYSRPTNPNIGQSIGKVDWQLTQNHSLFARYMLSTDNWNPAFAETSNVLATTRGGRDSDSQSLAIGDSMVFNSSVVNNVRVAINRTNVQRTHADFFGPRDVGVNVNTSLPHYMNLNVAGAFQIGTGTETNSYYRRNTLAFSDDLTMVRGNHQWGVGTLVALSDWNAASPVRSSGPFTFDGGATGSGLADFLIGDVREYRQADTYRQNLTQNYIGFYAQDTWQTSSRLTMNYGVRWEPWFPQQHVDGTIYNFSAVRFRAGQRSTVFPTAPPGLTYPGDPGFAGKAGTDRRWMTFAPRVGMAWQPTSSGLTAVRAGYGMNSDFVTGGFFFDASQAPPFGLDARLIRPGVGSFDDPWNGSGRSDPFPRKSLVEGGPVVFGQSAPFLAVPEDLKTTRVHSWNVGVQHQVGESLAVSASYVGNRMMNLWGDVTGNPGTIPAGASPTGPCTLRTPTGTQSFPNCSAASLELRREISQADPVVGQFIGSLDWITDYGWQQYHGLLLSAQRRLTNGASLSANYTVSTCEGLIGQGGGPLNPGTGYQTPVSLINRQADWKARLERDKGHCSFSPEHIFNMTASVTTPQFMNTAARLLASEWRLSGIFRASSGSFLNITSGLDRALTGAAVQRPNQVLDNPYGAKTANNWFNAAAFAQPEVGTEGNLGRNAYVGPGSRTLDLSLVRSFRFQSTHRLEARIEAFNALNWFRWGDPITAINNANFGRILTAGDPRVMQFALKYQF